MNKLDAWPCYKYGHKIPYDRIQNAYVTSFADSDKTISCARCNRKLDVSDYESPVVTIAKLQRELFSPTNYTPQTSHIASD